MKTHKNTRSVEVETINDYKTLAIHIAENDDYRAEWLETCKEEGFDYGKGSLYYLARKSLETNLMGFELKMAKELISDLIES